MHMRLVIGDYHSMLRKIRERHIQRHDGLPLLKLNSELLFASPPAGVCASERNKEERVGATARPGSIDGRFGRLEGVCVIGTRRGPVLGGADTFSLSTGRVEGGGCRRLDRRRVLARRKGPTFDRRRLCLFGEMSLLDKFVPSLSQVSLPTFAPSLFRPG